MTANTDKLLSILTGIFITVLVYFLVFWFHLALAKFILVPLFGTAICSTLNQLFNTVSFTPQMLPSTYAWACLIGGIFFWPHISSSKH
jgi:hypothetical protein